MNWDFPAKLKKDSQFFTLKTERLELRLLEQKDVPLRFSILEAHPEITEFMSFDPPQSVVETQAHFDIQKSDFEKSVKIAWTILYEGQLIGTIGLEDILWKGLAWEFNKGVIGYWMNPEFHGRGFMTEAVTAVMKFGFETLELNKIESSHVSENIASQRVIEKSGLRLVGERINHFKRHGRWWNDKIYELSNSEWKSRND